MKRKGGSRRAWDQIVDARDHARHQGEQCVVAPRRGNRANDIAWIGDGTFRAAYVDDGWFGADCDCFGAAVHRQLRIDDNSERTGHLDAFQLLGLPTNARESHAIRAGAQFLDAVLPRPIRDCCAFCLNERVADRFDANAVEGHTRRITHAARNRALGENSRRDSDEVEQKPERFHQPKFKIEFSHTAGAAEESEYLHRA